MEGLRPRRGAGRQESELPRDTPTPPQTCVAVGSGEVPRVKQRGSGCGGRVTKPVRPSCPADHADFRDLLAGWPMAVDPGPTIRPASAVPYRAGARSPCLSGWPGRWVVSGGRRWGRRAGSAPPRSPGPVRRRGCRTFGGRSKTAGTRVATGGSDRPMTKVTARRGTAGWVGREPASESASYLRPGRKRALAWVAGQRNPEPTYVVGSPDR